YAYGYWHATRKWYPLICSGKPGDSNTNACQDEHHQSVIKRAHCVLEDPRTSRDLVQKIDDDLDALFVHRDGGFILSINKKTKTLFQRADAVDNAAQTS